MCDASSDHDDTWLDGDGSGKKGGRAARRAHRRVVKGAGKQVQPDWCKVCFARGDGERHPCFAKFLERAGPVLNALVLEYAQRERELARDDYLKWANCREVMPTDSVLEMEFECTSDAKLRFDQHGYMAAFWALLVSAVPTLWHKVPKPVKERVSAALIDAATKAAFAFDGIDEVHTLAAVGWQASLDEIARMRDTLKGFLRR